MEKKHTNRISDAIPQRPASFDETVERTMKRVCQERAETKRAHAPSWTTQGGNRRRQRFDGFVRRFGVGVVVAELVICIALIGTVIALRSRSNTDTLSAAAEMGQATAKATDATPHGPNDAALPVKAPTTALPSNDPQAPQGADAGSGTFLFSDYDQESEAWTYAPLEGVLFTCDFDGDGSEEEISYLIEASSIRLSVGDRSIDVDFDLAGESVMALDKAILLDLDPQTPTKNLIVVCNSYEAEVRAVELHMEKGKLVRGAEQYCLGVYLDEEQNKLIRHEYVDLFGAKEGERTCSGDHMDPDSDWLVPAPYCRVTEEKLRKDRQRLIDCGWLLHLVRDLPCTIDGKADVIPQGSYIYLVRYHESGAQVEISTEDGKTHAFVTRDPDTEEHIFGIAGMDQSEYFDNFFYAD